MLAYQYEILYNVHVEDLSIHFSDKLMAMPYINKYAHRSEAIAELFKQESPRNLQRLRVYRAYLDQQMQQMNVNMQKGAAVNRRRHDTESIKTDCKQ